MCQTHTGESPGGVWMGPVVPGVQRECPGHSKQFGQQSKKYENENKESCKVRFVGWVKDVTEEKRIKVPGGDPCAALIKAKGRSG